MKGKIKRAWGLLKKQWKDADAQDLVEYALLLMMVGLAVVASIKSVSATIVNSFGNANQLVSALTSSAAATTAGTPGTVSASQASTTAADQAAATVNNNAAAAAFQAAFSANSFAAAGDDFAAALAFAAAAGADQVAARDATRGNTTGAVNAINNADQAVAQANADLQAATATGP